MQSPAHYRRHRQCGYALSSRIQRIGVQQSRLFYRAGQARLAPSARRICLLGRRGNRQRAMNASTADSDYVTYIPKAERLHRNACTQIRYRFW